MAVGALRIATTAVFAVALPLFLVTSGVRWVTLNENFYLGEFGKYHISQVTGLSADELRDVARAFITYFQDEPKRMDVTITRLDGPEPLFNERELAHMVDVQALMHRVFQLWGIALIALAASAVVMVATDPSTGAQALTRAAAIGGALAVLLVGALALGALFDFSQLFMQFHLLSFSNDLWLLDPRRDRLIQLFPQGFFLDAALFIAVQTVAVGALICAASLATLRALR